MAIRSSLPRRLGNNLAGLPCTDREKELRLAHWASCEEKIGLIMKDAMFIITVKRREWNSSRIAGDIRFHTPYPQSGLNYHHTCSMGFEYIWGIR
jgi:hypothetical protein